MKPQKKPQHELVTCFETTNCNFVAFSSNELAILPRLTFKNQTTEFGIDLEASVNCQNLQRYKFRMKASQLQKNTDRKSPITAN